VRGLFRGAGFSHLLRGGSGVGRVFVSSGLSDGQFLPWATVVEGGVTAPARYTTADGLPSNSVTQLLTDHNGFLWGGTYRGIFRVSTTALDMRAKGVQPSFTFHNYGHSDGLPAAECSGGLQPACWKADDGQLWFSTSAGAVRIDPDHVKKNLSPPLVIIETMTVNGEAVALNGTASDPQPRTIRPGRHRYEFQFTGINFTAPEKIGFQWRLNGQDSEWVDGRQQREAAYSGLPPGNYVFEVRARNNDGVWSPEPSLITFSVAPFFWQRPAVKAGFWFAGLSLPFLFITSVMRRRHRRELRHLEYERSLEQQRFRHKQAMQTERASIAAELHDDLGANLTQIQWLGEAVSPAGETASPSSEQLSRISRKCREMVCRIDEIVWAVNPQNDTLGQLVAYICEFAEQFFRDTPTRARIDVAPDIPQLQLESDVRHHLFLIAKEALHNVAKHARTDRVWIRITIDGGSLKILIEDRGCGFDAAMAEHGDGLANMRRRAELAGASLSIESDATSGTRVTLIHQLDPTRN
jgi:signal transduction histidine kinase